MEQARSLTCLQPVHVDARLTALMEETLMKSHSVLNMRSEERRVGKECISCSASENKTSKYLYISELFGFFFSSRRRHTSFSRDWSSDVCSSDLHESACPVKIRSCP